MSFVQELAIGIGAIIMILGSIAVIIAALWGKPDGGVTTHGMNP